MHALASMGDWWTGDNIYPGRARIARETGYTERTIQRHMPFLQASRLIERTRPGIDFDGSATIRNGRLIPSVQYKLTIGHLMPLATRAPEALIDPQTTEGLRVFAQVYSKLRGDLYADRTVGKLTQKTADELGRLLERRWQEANTPTLFGEQEEASHEVIAHVVVRRFFSQAGHDGKLAASKHSLRFIGSYFDKLEHDFAREISSELFRRRRRRPPVRPHLRIAGTDSQPGQGGKPPTPEQVQQHMATFLAAVNGPPR